MVEQFIGGSDPHSRTLSAYGPPLTLLLLIAGWRAGVETRAEDVPRKQRPLLAIRSKHLTLTAVRFSPDGKRLVTASTDNAAESARHFVVRDANTGKVKVVKARLPDAGIDDILFSPDGKWLLTFDAPASSESFRRVDVWAAATGKHRAGLGYQPQCYSFQPDGKRLFLVDYGPDKALSVQVRDPVNHFKVVQTLPLKKVAQRVKAARDRVQSILLSPTCDRLVVIESQKRGKGEKGSPSKSVVSVWKVSNGEKTCTFRMDSAREVAFSPDGRRLAASHHAEESRGTLVTVWGISTGTKLHAFRGKEEVGSGLMFSPDGKQLAVVILRNRVENSEVKFLDVQTGKERGGIRTKASDRKSPSFSPDGKRIAIISWSGVEVWRVPSASEAKADQRGSRGPSR
jgi:WD40 repeat protein